ncbi:SNF2 family N-terminal domain-containing protein [Gautieria morchelliformis]|nr:SNF2 family N-terminal domain-containing protein [Gautieria morchelliformis]
MTQPQSRKTAANRVLSALDNALAAANVSSITPYTEPGTSTTPVTPPGRKRRLDDSPPVTRAKRRSVPEVFDDFFQHRSPCTPRWSAVSGDQPLDMESLFPNAFHESPKGKLDNNAQIRSENRKIGPDLSDALKMLQLRSPNDFCPGLEIKLMKHQIIGTSWMLKQEFDPVNRGGILADEMGLGKTIQMIALMVTNQRDSRHQLHKPEKQDEDDDEEGTKGKGKLKAKPKKMGYGKTTLIVAPASLLHQWREEIETKCQEGLLRVHIHHGKYKLKSVKELRGFDVILVSYQTLTAEFPTKLDPSEQSGWLPEMGGILARMKWFRVVLDEAQVVRNRLTQSAQCIFRLQTKYRWCLSGTPIFNGVTDIFSYLRFCRPGYYSWDHFNIHICRVEKRDPVAATKKANEWLDPLMLRRTKKSKLDGRFILEELPPKTTEIVELEFSDGERRIYDDLAAKVEKTVGEIISKGLEDKYHMYILVLILRLRQVCGHPILMLGLEDALDDPTKMPQVEKDKEIARARRELGRQFVDEMKAKFRKRAMKRDEVGANHDEEWCRGCREVFSGNAMIVACGHEACADCLDDLEKSELRHDKDIDNLDKDDTPLRPCPTCKKLIDPTKAYKSAAFEVSQEELVFGGGGYKKMMAAEKQKTKSWFVDSDDDDDLPDAGSLMASLGKRDHSNNNSHCKVATSSTPMPSQTPASTATIPPSESTITNLERWKNPQTPSTKLVALVDMLKTWDYNTESAMDKVIIYSQWTSMLDLVEGLFEQHGMSALRYDGKMGREERDEAISRFKKMGGPKYILISIKSGSVGLNLTCANRIVNLDLSWNMAAENQAYDRAHRIGQAKPVHVKRLIIKGTIEERILQLQRDKQQMADATLGEGDAPLQRLSNSLTARELTSLIVPPDGKDKRAADK